MIRVKNLLSGLLIIVINLAHLSGAPIVFARPATIDATLSRVLIQAAIDQPLDVIVTLRNQADIGQLDRSSVPGVLQHHAATTQADLLSYLRVQSASQVKTVIPLWIDNAIAVSASRQVILDLARRSDIARIQLDEILPAPDRSSVPVAPNLISLGVPEVWQRGITGQGVVVAVLDSGVDLLNPDLKAKWRGGSNSWFDPYGEHDMPVDLSGHGTQMLGVILGGNDAGTVIGVAPGAQWIAAKIFNDRGRATTSAIHRALQWVLDPDGDLNTHDAPQVVNNSWSAANPGCNSDFAADLQALRAAGILPVFAAGTNRPVSPANLPEAFAVGAIDDQSAVLADSAHGPSECGSAGSVYPQLVAPGANIHTTDHSGAYIDASGTSLAAAHVSGALALLLSVKPQLSADDQADLLISTAVDLGERGPDNEFGYGRLDIAALIDRAAPSTPRIVTMMEILAGFLHALVTLVIVLRRLKRSKARWLSLIIIGVIALSGVRPALAHAIITRTDPADGAVLTEAPRQIRLWFSEEVALNLSKFQVFDSHGQALPGITAHADATDPALVIIDLPELKPDAYRVAWAALSTDDLHITSGSIVFGVQTAAEGAASAPPDTAPQPLEVIVRWIDFVALATLIGALALAVLMRPPDYTDAQTAAASERRLLNLALCATGAALITSFGGVLVQAVVLSNGAAIGDATRQLMTQTSYGSRWLMREGWSLALLLIIVWQRRQPQISRMILGATMPLLVALVVLQAMNGHATSFDDNTSLVRVIADALHLLGAGVWVGGLIALAVACVPLLRRSPVEAAQARVMLRRFGLIASASLSVLFVTGLYNSGQQVASLDALLFTSYGRALLAKIVLVFGVGLIGLINSSLLHPRVAEVIRRVLHRPIGWTLIPARFVRRTVVVEMTGAIGVVLLAAMLGSSLPARGPEFDPPGEGATLETASANVKDLFVTFSIKPNRPGQIFISIGAFDTRRPAPAPIERVSVQLTPPDGSTQFTFDAESLSKGKYQITGNTLGLPGDWGMTVTVQRPGLADTVWTFPWNVMPTSRLSPRPVVVSNQPLEPIVNVIALLLAVILGGGLFGLIRQQVPPKRGRTRGNGTQVTR